jgi:catechol 2,3-dioxygenase-like lactoylglutathione lyase family enzyme
MFDHVTIRVSDYEASERFYSTVLRALGIEPSSASGTSASWQEFMITASDLDHPTTRRLHVGSVAPSRELVDAFCVDHVWIRVADVERARGFYDTIAPPAGLRKDRDTDDRVQYRGSTGTFSLLPGEPTEHLHMAFPTSDDGDVERFHAAAVAAGYESNGEPGERARYHPGYYAAFVLDPDGNNIEVVNHHRQGA